MLEEKANSNISEDKKQLVLRMIRPIFVKQLAIDEGKVFLHTKLIEDLGIDSLDTVELIMAFEDQFDIEIDDDDVENSKIKTVEDAVVYLIQRINI